MSFGAVCLKPSTLDAHFCQYCSIEVLVSRSGGVRTELDPATQMYACSDIFCRLQ